MPFLLAAFALVGCDTDDLRNDIDELKNRVKSLEVIVSGLNDNVNALRAFIDGNKTIKSFEKTADGYKIVLSDGEELNIVQGSAGQVKTPEITIGDDGCWVIGNENTGVKAVGDNAPMPKFSIDTENYWTVDFGEGPVKVTDAGGNPVKATTNESVGFSDAFFKKVEIDNDKMVLTFKDGEKYSLPIVKDLTCRIETDGVEGFKNGVLTVPFGATVHLTVNVSGDNFAVTAPTGWTAVLGEPVEGNAELSLTAPAAEVSPLSRAVADNTRDLTLQVNKGVNWAVDKIQVEAKVVINSYFTLYEAGKTFTIGDIEINKDKFTKAVLVEGDKTLSVAEDAFGIYFVKPGATLTYNLPNTISSKYFIVIGDNELDNTACFKLSQRFQTNMGSKPGETDGYFLWKNVKFDATSLTVPTFISYRNGEQDKAIIFDKCNIFLQAKNFFELTSNGRTFTNLQFLNSRIKLSGNMNLIFTKDNTSNAFGTLTMKNNIVYSENVIKDFKIVNSNKEEAGMNKFVMENNTFVNVTSTWSGMYYKLQLQNVVLQNNLFWVNVSLDENVIILRPKNQLTGSICKNNVGYSLTEGAKTWISIFGFDSLPFEGKEQIVNLFGEENNPFKGGQFDLKAGIFVPNPTYANYGAKLD